MKTAQTRGFRMETVLSSMPKSLRGADGREHTSRAVAKESGRESPWGYMRGYTQGGVRGGHADVRQVRVNAVRYEGEREEIVGRICRHVVVLIVVAQARSVDGSMGGYRCGRLCVTWDVVTARVTGWGRTAEWGRGERLVYPTGVGQRNVPEGGRRTSR